MPETVIRTRGEMKAALASWSRHLRGGGTASLVVADEGRDPTRFEVKLSWGKLYWSLDGNGWHRTRGEARRAAA